MITLYGSKHSCSVTIHFLLELLWAEYEKVNAQIGSDELKKINPRWAVPAIVDSEVPGLVLTQLTAIAKYLLKKYPNNTLGSDEDLISEYKFNNLLALLNSDIHPSFGPFFMTGKFTTSSDTEVINDVKACGIKRIEANMHQIDSLLEGKEYLLFDRLTFADLYAYVLSTWWAMILWEKFWELKNLSAFSQRIWSHPVIQKVYNSYN